MKYRTKPCEIEAFEWGKDDVPQWWKDREDITIGVQYGSAFIPTLEGTMEAKVGDFIIKGLKGELYPCKPDIFIMKYEPLV